MYYEIPAGRIGEIGIILNNKRPFGNITTLKASGGWDVIVNGDMCNFSPTVQPYWEKQLQKIKSVRYCSIHPTTLADFTNLPFEDNSFYHIVFDPPHLLRISENAWLAKKYGKLSDGWEQMIHDGFWECMRVLKPNGTLVFKWAETDIKLSKILKVIGAEPLYGHRSGKHMTTHWMAFIKD